MKSLYRSFFFLLILTSLAYCDNSPLNEGGGLEDVSVKSFYLSNGSKQVQFTWTCSESAEGYIFYSNGNGSQNILISPKEGKTHLLPLTNLTPNSEYTAYLGCGKPEDRRVMMVPFKTWISDDPIKTRGIWLVGGVGADNNPVAQIDLYDPVDNHWYPSITRVPTPRAFASVVNFKGKIFVIGGLTKSGSTFSVSSAVEAYDPFTGIWTTYSSAPDAIHSGISATVGNEIYIIANALDTNVTVGYPTSRVYKLFPEIGTQGTWSPLFTSLTQILPRVDMGGCGINGSIFYTGGRLASDGSASSFNSDAYIPASNSTTSIGEPSINTSARHGMGTACYRPIPSDPNPGDGPGVLVVGGSTAGNLFQPVTQVTPTNLYDFYRLGTSSANFQAGPVLPVATYFPAAEISYDLRMAFVFGGATALNIPSKSVYSIDLGSPVAGPWTSITSEMPVARYGHSAVIISR
ncbi:kelch repeat-containing protein [Leptospira sp. WS58.C1]|uniref:kelch repeat-containing protein n=1 Tax=Leptospira cinconiae TaxID=3235173 RepID=UPI00349EF20C